MFIVRETAETVAFYANKPTDRIDWSGVAPGLLVIQLSAEDYRAAFDWQNAAEYIGGRGAEPITDAEGREPGAPDYVETLDEGEPPTLESLGNKVIMVASGAVQLCTAAGAVHRALSGTVAQAA